MNRRLEILEQILTVCCSCGGAGNFLLYHHNSKRFSFKTDGKLDRSNISNTEACRSPEDVIYRKLTNVLSEMTIEIPEIPELRGQKAIRALYNAITELEEQRGDQLTDKQARALIKIAKGMISSIQVERERAKPKKRISWLPFSKTKAPRDKSL